MAPHKIILLYCCIFVGSCGGSNVGERECGSNALCAPDSSLLGAVWELKDFTADSGEIETASEETKYQILLKMNSSDLDAFIGCVNYSDGSYEINDGFLTLKLGIRNSVVCNTDTSEFADQNNAIMGLLESEDVGSSLPLMFSTSYQILSLEASDGRLLRFVEVLELIREQ